jgi:hypothetical protein
MQPQDLLSRLRIYALRIGSPTVDLASFLRTLSPEQAELEQIEAAVRDLSFRGALVIPPEGARLTSVTFPDFPQMLLDEEYRRIAEDPARCFPDEHSLPVAIPESDVFAVEAKTGLGELLQGDAPEVSAGQTHQQEEMRPPSRSPGEEMRPPSRSPGIVKLLFPENVPALLVPRSFIGTRLVLAAVEKIGRYLQDPKNAAYADVRMRTALRGSDVTVRLQPAFLGPPVERGCRRRRREDGTHRLRPRPSAVRAPRRFCRDPPEGSLGARAGKGCRPQGAGGPGAQGAVRLHVGGSFRAQG